MTENETEVLERAYAIERIRDRLVGRLMGRAEMNLHNARALLRDPSRQQEALDAESRAKAYAQAADDAREFLPIVNPRCPGCTKDCPGGESCPYRSC